MAATTSNKPLPGTETVVKQEKLDDSHIEIGEIQTEGFPPFQGTFKFAEEEAAGPSEQIDEPPPKRARRAAATRKPVQMSPETDEEDDVEALEAVTKVEDESESEGEAGDDGTGEVDEPEPAFVDVPSASIVDDQPGPSGLGKDGVVPPYVIKEEIEINTDNFDLTVESVVQQRRNFKQEISDVEENIPLIKIQKSASRPKRQCATYLKTWNAYSLRKHIAKNYKKLQKLEKPLDDPKSETCHPLNSFKLKCPDHTFKYIEGLEKYICHTCSKTFSSEDLINDHIATEHNHKYACETCPDVFSTASSFAHHVRTHSESKELACPLCSYITTSSYYFDMHLNRTHFHKFTFYCEVCGKGCNYQDELDAHVKCHKGIKSEICVVCQKEYTSVGHLVRHQIVQHTVSIEGAKLPKQCEFCLKIFKCPSHLQRHLKENHGIKPAKDRHLCDICGKDFTYRNRLVDHYRIHTGVKPFSCKYCQKTFRRTVDLVVHERIHTGEKPYFCTTCGRSFSQSAYFTIHLRTHSGERPYNCLACNKGFVSKSSLALHRKSCQEIVK